MSTNNDNNGAIGAADKSTAPASMATTAVSREVFVGIDTAKSKQVVTRFIAGEGPKPAEAMSVETLLTRIARWVKEGWRVHCVYEAGPTGFGLCRRIVSLGATCLVVRPKRLERHERRRKTIRRTPGTSLRIWRPIALDGPACWCLCAYRANKKNCAAWPSGSASR